MSLASLPRPDATPARKSRAGRRMGAPALAAARPRRCGRADKPSPRRPAARAAPAAGGPFLTAPATAGIRARARAPAPRRRGSSANGARPPHAGSATGSRPRPGDRAGAGKTANRAASARSGPGLPAPPAAGPPRRPADGPSAGRPDRFAPGERGAQLRLRVADLRRPCLRLQPDRGAGFADRAASRKDSQVFQSGEQNLKYRCITNT